MVVETTSVTWPGWEVVRKLGEGSFGGVYEIRRTLPDGTVRLSFSAYSRAEEVDAFARTLRRIVR